MNKPVKARIIASKEEAEAEQRARKLQAQGLAAFGDPNQKIDFSSDLDEASNNEAAPEESPVEEEANEEQELSDDPIVKMDQIHSIFVKSNPSFPTGKTLMNWKTMCGNIFIVDAGEQVFIYRYLKRQEWIQMNQDQSFLKQRVDQREDTIFNRCVLWPKLPPQDIAALPAGCVSSIVAQIEQQSMFIDPRELASLTIKL
jgi:hypothetical protein